MRYKGKLKGFCFSILRPIVSLCLSVPVLILLLPLTANAVLLERGPSLEQLGSAVSPVADPVSASARVLNPAAGSAITSWQLSASFSRSFNLPEFDRFQIAFSAPVGLYTAGVWASGFGQTLYNERTMGLNFSGPVLQDLYVGLGLSGTQIHLKNYGNDYTYGVDAGLFYNRPSFSVGAAVQNGLTTALDAFGDDRPPLRSELAGRYRVTSTLFLFGELLVEQDQDLGWRIGTEAWLFEPVAIRAGYDDMAERFHLGLAVQWDGLTGHGAYNHHPYLGWSHAFGMQWYSGANSR